MFNIFKNLNRTELEGEGVCIDTFDYLGDSNQGTPEKTTRVVVGIHDNNSWESFKKTIQEMPIFLSNNDAAAKAQTATSNASVNSTNSLHNMLVQNLQTNSILPRLNYADSSSLSNLNFDHESFQHEIKLASKVLVFDFNTNIFSGIISHSFYFYTFYLLIPTTIR